MNQWYTNIVINLLAYMGFSDQHKVWEKTHFWIMCLNIDSFPGDFWSAKAIIKPLFIRFVCSHIPLMSFPGFAIITWNNPKKLEKPWITKRQHLAIFMVDLSCNKVLMVDPGFQTPETKIAIFKFYTCHRRFSFWGNDCLRKVSILIV